MYLNKTLSFRASCKKNLAISKFYFRIERFGDKSFRSLLTPHSARNLSGGFLLSSLSQIDDRTLTRSRNRKIQTIASV